MLRLVRIAVLIDGVAGMAGEHDVIHFAPAAGAQIDHFADVGKMVANRMARYLAGRARLGHDIQEVVPLRVTEQVLQIARQPGPDAAIGLLRVRLEGGGE